MYNELRSHVSVQAPTKDATCPQINDHRQIQLSGGCRDEGDALLPSLIGLDGQGLLDQQVIRRPVRPAIAGLSQVVFGWMVRSPLWRMRWRVVHR